MDNNQQDYPNWVKIIGQIFLVNLLGEPFTLGDNCMALIRIFGGDGLISLSYVKFCADSQNVNLIYLTHDIFLKTPFLGQTFAFLVKNVSHLAIYFGH